MNGCVLNNNAKFQKWKSSCELTTSKRKRNEAFKVTESIKNNFPNGIAQPALRALAKAGYRSLAALTSVREEDILKLHGMGPKAIGIIKKAFSETGKSFSN